MRSCCEVYFTLLLVLVVFARVVYSVPHEFCMDDFDEGDCGEAPVDVVYYYKPGSRCEVRKWRGCTTLNKFPDYFSCLHYCVMRIWGNEPPAIPVEAEEEWIEDIQELDVDAIKVIDDVLEDVVKQKPLEKLTLHKQTEADEETTTPVPEPTEPETPKPDSAGSGSAEEVITT